MGQEPQELKHDPEALRHDIDRTREGMNATLDQIEDRVSPSRIVERRKAQARTTLAAARERVMGTAQQVRAEGRSKADSAGARLEHVSDEVSERMDHLQEEGKRRYEGNPLAAGLIAFGAGALLGSLLGTTEPEQQIAHDLKERLLPATDELRAAAQEVAEDVKHEAQDRVGHVKETASEATEAVKEDARQSAGDVRAETRERAEHLKDETQR
jgi:gas vesicle protein